MLSIFFQFINKFLSIRIFGNDIITYIIIALILYFIFAILSAIKGE